MRRVMKAIGAMCMVVMICMTLTFVNGTSSVTNTVYAHPGRTDSSEGHKDNKNKSGLGSYHYHCGGHSAHLHENGVCPYSSSAKKTSSHASTKKSSVSKKEVKEVQKALNDLGYDCGKADGVCGNKTIKAIKSFQKDNGLTVDGKIGKQVKKELEID